tara:strand:- start:994 stop:1125 length:132 start_codon:yes stop_codon:yes gene_type:complete
MVIHNEIFCSYRQEQKKQKEAIEYLQSKGFIISKKEKTYASSK